MRRTFFIVLLAIFFTFDIFFAISTAVADNLKSSPNMEILHIVEAQKVMSENQITPRVTQPQQGAPMNQQAPKAF